MIVHGKIEINTINGACTVRFADENDKLIIGVQFERGSFALPDMGEMLRLATQAMRESRQKEPA